jgi:putative restriction endonuclease
MHGKLDFYLTAFAKLRVDRNRKSWSRLTNYCSPYKPFLLLSLLDHMDTGRISKNFIEPSFELSQTFLQYTGHLSYFGRQASMAYPFYHLESSDFWIMIPQPGEQHQKGLAIRSMKRLRELYIGARFSDDLYTFLQMTNVREKFKNVLIQTYFAPELRNTISEQSHINCASDRYSYMLLGVAQNLPPYLTTSSETENEDKVRDQGFRKAIVKLYDHRCALCGIKMCKPEGRTVVDAAHIKPWCQSYNDEPTNGMALCKLCHWSFDEGLMSVDKQYHVLISPVVRNLNNLPGHILTLSDRPMFRPMENSHWPDQDNFQWHRKERFRKSR